MQDEFARSHQRISPNWSFGVSPAASIRPAIAGMRQRHVVLRPRAEGDLRAAECAKASGGLNYRASRKPLKPHLDRRPTAGRVLRRTSAQGPEFFIRQAVSVHSVLLGFEEGVLAAADVTCPATIQFGGHNVEIAQAIPVPHISWIARRCRCLDRQSAEARRTAAWRAARVWHCSSGGTRGDRKSRG